MRPSTSPTPSTRPGGGQRSQSKCRAVQADADDRESPVSLQSRSAPPQPTHSSPMCGRPPRTERPNLRAPDADHQEAAIGPDRRECARLSSASRPRSAITVRRGCTDVRRRTCPPRRPWYGKAWAGACRAAPRSRPAVGPAYLIAAMTGPFGAGSVMRDQSSWIGRP